MKEKIGTPSPEEFIKEHLRHDDGIQRVCREFDLLNERVKFLEEALACYKAISECQQSLTKDILERMKIVPIS